MKDEIDPSGRWWILGPRRSIDFSVDSYLGAENPKFKSVKGLWWEAHQDHLLVNSYFTTLLEPPAVLDYFNYFGFSCEVEACLIEQFTRSYGVNRVLLGISSLHFNDPGKKSCLTSWGEQRKIMAPRVTYNGVDFNLIKLKGLSHSMVESVDPNEFLIQEGDNKFNYTHPMQIAFSECTKKGMAQNHIFLWSSKATPPLSELLREKTTLVPFHWSNESPGKYKIEPQAQGASWYWIKLSSFPGLTIKGLSSGKNLPFYDANPGFVVKAEEPFEIEYQKSWQMKLGYGVSILTLIILVGLGMRRFKLERHK